MGSRLLVGVEVGRGGRRLVGGSLMSRGRRIRCLLVLALVPIVRGVGRERLLVLVRARDRAGLEDRALDVER